MTATSAPPSPEDKAEKLKTVVAALDDLEKTVTIQTLNMETGVFLNSDSQNQWLLKRESKE